MSEFVLTGSDVFGRYCRIEQLRYGVPNEMHLYKVVASLRSNCWCEVPYKTASKEVRHDSIEDCVLAICCGIDETEVLRFRVADVEFLPQKSCDRDALLALEEEMFEDATGLAFISQLEKNEELQDLQSTMAKALMDYDRRIRDALGVES